MLCDLVRKRINELLCETHLTMYQVRIKSNIPRSTINTIMQNKCNNVSLKTIVLLCMGFDITLSHFFNSKLFKIEDIDI